MLETKDVVKKETGATVLRDDYNRDEETGQE